MSGAEPSCGTKYCGACSKKKSADEPKAEDQRKNEEQPMLCKSCNEDVNEKPKLCTSCNEYVNEKPKLLCTSCKKEKKSLTKQQKFIADHKCEPAPKGGVDKSVCRDIHCKDHHKKLVVKPSSIEIALPPMMPPLPSPLFYHQRPPFYHPNRPMYPPLPLPPPPPQFSPYNRSMQQYRSPFGGGYRDNFW